MMSDYYLAVVKNREIALRFSRKNAPAFFWEIKRLKVGDIKDLLGKDFPKNEMLVPCSNLELSRCWDMLHDYDENERSK